MSDLISREALLEAINGVEVTWYLEDGQTSDTYDGTTVVDIIEKQPSAEPQWIPCSERLPKKAGNYMTCDKRGNIHVFWYDDGQTYPFNISEYHTKYYPVIAWMPLPRPYKEGGTK